MKDEIKSFLVQIKGNDEWKEIYNYITNLQEENEKLKNIIIKIEDCISQEKDLDLYCNIIVIINKELQGSDKDE